MRGDAVGYQEVQKIGRNGVMRGASVIGRELPSNDRNVEVGGAVVSCHKVLD